MNSSRSPESSDLLSVWYVSVAAVRPFPDQHCPSLMSPRRHHLSVFLPIVHILNAISLSNPNVHKDIFKKFISLPSLYKKALLPPSTADDGFMAIKSVKLLQSVGQTLMMP